VKPPSPFASAGNWMPARRHLTLFDGITMPEPMTLFDDYSGRASVARKQEMEIDRHMNFGADLKIEPAPGSPEERGYKGNIGRLNEEHRAMWDAIYEPKNAEFQALVAPSAAPVPRRVTQGVEASRVAMILAVLRRRALVQLHTRAVYVSTWDGARDNDPANDLAPSIEGFFIMHVDPGGLVSAPCRHT